MAEKPSIRVLMVSPFPEHPEKVVGGVAGVAYYLCQHLNDIDGIEISVLVPDCPIDSPKRVWFSGVQVDYLPRVKATLGERVLQQGSAKLIAEFVAAGDFDLVHVQAAPEWASRIDIPCVVTLHGILEQDMLYRQGRTLFRKLMLPLVRMREQIKRSKIDNLIVINPYVLDSIGDALTGRSWHIENPIRRDFYDIQRQVQLNSILCVGVVSPRKNILRLIEALPLIRESVPDVVLKIAGSLSDQVYVDQCQAEVKRLGLERHVEFLGSVSVEELSEHLAKSHVMALSSLQETAPLSIAEAMAAGVPVVASDICGIPHMIEDGVTGVLVDPSDPTEIAKGIIAAFDFDVELVAQACRNSTRSRFCGDVVAHRTMAVYEEVLLDEQAISDVA